MYNLNVNVSAAGTAVNNLLAVESACTTPRTPEILNSLIAMTNPLDGYSFKNDNSANPSASSSALAHDSDSSSSAKDVDTPGGSSPPSVQHTCSQLIKAGLKLSIESKRKHSADNDDFLDLDNVKRIKRSDDEDGDRSRSPNQGLTPEDEERRRRRRERNKIAATKCRLKKREKTVILVQESEILETQNIDLKTQIQELESQRRRLVDMLTMHTPSCIKSTSQNDRYPATDGRFIEDDSYGADGGLPPVTSLATSVIEANYNRPSSVDIGPTFRSQNIEYCNRASSVESNYNRIQYAKPPSIIVEEENYSPPSQLTNLDNGIYYNSQQCHNYTSSNQNYNSSNVDNGCMA